MAEDEKCRLLGGFFASFIQGLLAFVCIGTLILKRQQEVPQRDWLVWFLDVTKQGVGSSFGHFSNIYLSMVIANSAVQSDECQWYCLTYVADCTIGTVMNLCLLNAFEAFVKRYPQQCRATMTFGEYGNPPQLSVYLPQLCVWLIIVIFSKILILLSLSQLIIPIDSILTELFFPLRRYPKIELVTVMIIIPTVLNSIQFWVTDTFLKRNDSGLQRNNYSNDDEDDENARLDETLIADDDEEVSIVFERRHISSQNKYRKERGQYRFVSHSYSNKHSSKSSSSSSENSAEAASRSPRGRSDGDAGDPSNSPPPSHSNQWGTAITSSFAAVWPFVVETVSAFSPFQTTSKRHARHQRTYEARQFQRNNRYAHDHSPTNDHLTTNTTTANNNSNNNSIGGNGSGSREGSSRKRGGGSHVVPELARGEGAEVAMVDL